MRKLLLTLCIALPAFARITTDPAGPTTRTALDVIVDAPCETHQHTLTRVGNVLKIHVTGGSPICDPPVFSPYAVPVGFLPVGEYRVEVTVNDDPTIVSGTFVVRNGERTPIEVHPFAVPSSPYGLQLRVQSVTDNILCNPDCPSISVGAVNVPAADISSAGFDAVWFNAPAHAPGLVDVTVRTSSKTYVLPGALYYYDRSAEPNPSVFERILFPVLFSTGGVNGSQWISEAALSNPTRWFIENFNRIDPNQCIDRPCFERLSPGTLMKFNGSGYPHGVALLSPRGESDRLAMSLRVRDVARQAESFGSEVPVVREKDLFTNGELTLLDVPVDPRYRTKLRVYVYDSNAEVFATIDHEPGHGAQFESILIPMSRACSGVACAWTPFYGEADLSAGDPNERVNIYVDAGVQGAPAWAFASVTNNETQQVTIITPDGAGGHPCYFCEVPR